MISRCFLSFAIPLLLTPLAQAEQQSLMDRPDCQTLLRSVAEEFSRIPNDFRQGLITREVPMNVETLRMAYRRGIFPWGQSADGDVEWYSPPRRGILDLRELRIPRSDRKILERMIQSGEYTVTFDRDFEGVIRACAETPRWSYDVYTGKKRLAGQWISPLFVEQYTRLHHAGIARSVEVWRDGQLVGGLYGVFIEGVFSGESMFHAEANTSKLAYYSLLQRLIMNGHVFIDTQQARPRGNDSPQVGLAAKWGAQEISRFEFTERLKEAQRVNRVF